MTTLSGFDARTGYLVHPVSRRILSTLKNTSENNPRYLSNIVAQTGLPGDEVATWLLDMKRNGFVDYRIDEPGPGERVEPMCYRTPLTEELLTQLEQYFAHI